MQWCNENHSSWFIASIPRTEQIKWVREVGSGSPVIDGSHQLLEGCITDITDWKVAEETIQRQVRRFQALRAIDAAISAGPDLQFTLGILLEQIMAQLNVDAADILLHKIGTTLLEYGARRGFRIRGLSQVQPCG